MKLLLHRIERIQLKKSVKAYWWRNAEYPNLGDEVTAILLERYFQISASRSNAKAADLFSTGSILGWIRSDKDHERKRAQHVVGSGFMHAHDSLKYHDLLQIHSVRGHLSRQKIGWVPHDRIGLGDPGLLVSEFSKIKTVSHRNRIAVILHYSMAGDESVQSKFGHLPVDFLDIRTMDIDNFLSELAAHEIVLSQSLHGLIFADALGIPNAWMRIGRGIGPADFKFFDYFSSIGRDFNQAITGVPKNIREVQANIYSPVTATIVSLQREIVRSFEESLSQI